MSDANAPSLTPPARVENATSYGPGASQHRSSTAYARTWEVGTSHPWTVARPSATLRPCAPCSNASFASTARWRSGRATCSRSNPDATRPSATSCRGARLAGSDLILPAGTVTIGHYWAGRPYTAYHWLSGELTLGLYCSVAELLEIGAALIAYRDLAVDLLIRPDGSCDVLDEHELPAGSPDAAAVARALAELRADPAALLAEIETATRRALAARLYDGH